ncbi:hypothetical protein H5410_064906 [Solanum commersonii]|uniref:Uncharacterized protein n=1 Tax=Solanum commersonii TaxID=4109 RepID=A0A9J5VY38_SOLCO|nr:hypothetical protein H5410_064906 [Solanum commersonii]
MAEQEEKKQKTQQMEEKNTYKIESTKKERKKTKDESKVGLLKSLSGADEGLNLFEGDIYRAEEFEVAIQGCEFVFHLVTPLLHSQGSQVLNYQGRI